MQNLVSLKDLRLKLTDFTNRVLSNGESFIILKKSKPVFKIVPIEEETWETIVDFTEIKPTGVPLEKVKAALKKMS